MLDLFFIFRMVLLFCGVYFIMNDLFYFIQCTIVTLNGRSVVITFLFDWMSLLFMGFVFIISSLVILCSDDYTFGYLSIFRFILLVLMFVVSIMFLIVKYRRSSGICTHTCTAIHIFVKYLPGVV